MDKKTIMTMKKTFDDIMHTTEDGSVEFWYARELMECLGYATWRRFKEAIERAKESCESAGIEVSDHFAGTGKMIDLPKGAKREVDDIKRYPKGGTYRDYFYYACKHPTGTTGHKCDYHKQWGQDIVNDAVAELIKKMVTSPDFEKGIREKIAARVDTSELEQELDGLKKKMRQLEVSKDKIAIQMDNLDVTDSMYEKKYDDLQKRFYDKYDEMALTENHMDEIQSRLAHIRRKQLSGDRIYNFLIAFDKLYDKLSDAEKKEFMGTFVESIELYPERLENGKFLKHIHFRFPVYYNGTVIDDISWENGSTVDV